MTKKVSRIKKIDKTTEILSNLKKIDPSEIQERARKQYKEEDELYGKRLAEYNEAKQEETARIEKLGCPCCKSTEKQMVTLRQPRTEPLVLGGRNAPIKTLAEYYVCQGCGIMYVDLHKKELTAPEKPNKFYRIY